MKYLLDPCMLESVNQQECLESHIFPPHRDICLERTDRYLPKAKVKKIIFYVVPTMHPHACQCLKVTPHTGSQKQLPYVCVSWMIQSFFSCMHTILHLSIYFFQTCGGHYPTALRRVRPDNSRTGSMHAVPVL